MVFLDEALVEFRSGRGGSGAVSFHREKHVPRGGPNGEDGGRGGDVRLIADRNIRTLYDFKLHHKIEAENGAHALGNKKGRHGKSVDVKVPVGTIVFDTELDVVLIDLVSHGMSYLVCKGGRGGHGNRHYVSSVRQVPNFAEKGEPGETVHARLELKLLADVGLIGLPNAGKSTLLSAVSAARPKVANYPFTTVVPNLGVVHVGDETFVMSDLPGLIEGAAQGHGLGHAFLKHAERTKVLIHVVDAYPIDGSDPIANYELIERELHSYSDQLWGRPRIIALNKCDLASAGSLGPIREHLEQKGHPLFAISAATGMGLEPLMFETLHVLHKAPVDDAPVLTLRDHRAEKEDAWSVERQEGAFVVTGRRVERIVAMTDLDNRDALRYLHRRLERIGVIDKLREVGARDGDTVIVGEIEFAFEERA